MIVQRREVCRKPDASSLGVARPWGPTRVTLGDTRIPVHCHDGKLGPKAGWCRGGGGGVGRRLGLGLPSEGHRAPTPCPPSIAVRAPASARVLAPNAPGLFPSSGFQAGVPCMWLCRVIVLRVLREARTGPVPPPRPLGLQVFCPSLAGCLFSSIKLWVALEQGPRRPLPPLPRTALAPRQRLLSEQTDQ